MGLLCLELGVFGVGVFVLFGWVVCLVVGCLDLVDLVFGWFGVFLGGFDFLMLVGWVGFWVGGFMLFVIGLVLVGVWGFWCLVCLGVWFVWVFGLFGLFGLFGVLN